MLLALAIFVATIALVIWQPKGLGIGWSAMGGAAIALLSLVVQTIASVIAPLLGAGPTGDLLEYWTYLITALLIPPAAVLWALVDKKGEWSTLVVGVGILACAVMVYRMHQIWFVQVA